VQLHQDVRQEDLIELPVALQADLPRYQQVLSLDPYATRKVPSHGLRGELTGYRALEISWSGIAYRLIYRVYDTPAPRRVVIMSFAEHDPAYERAIARKDL
jgi:hypothetical protein